MSIIVQPSNISEWYELIKEGEASVGVRLDDSIESYLILTLDKFIRDDLLATPISISFLKSISSFSAESNYHLRKLGDRCLIISGLFPERADKINVSVAYFIEIGTQAYLAFASRTNIKQNPKLFQDLGSKFADIRSVLTAMRSIGETRVQH